MNREQIIREIKKYFSCQELVCQHTYTKWQERSWNFLDTKALHTLLVLRRDVLRVPLVCNDYKYGGKNTQRGLRCNCCQLVKNKTNANINYLTQHGFGKAFDLVSAKMSASDMRKLIERNKNLLPYNVRIEQDVTWLHIDVMEVGSEKLTYFKG